MINSLELKQSFLEKASSENNKRVTEWIKHFESSILRLDKQVSAIEQAVSTGLAGPVRGILHNDTGLEKIKADLSASLSSALAMQLKELELFKQALKQELEVFAKDFELKEAPLQAEEPSEPVINVNNVNNVNPVMPEPGHNAYNGLSTPEKWLVGVLFNSETPLSYSQIAERTGKSVSTARVYMNQLKLKGFVEESSLPNGIKIFSLKHDAKVRKLYNV